MPNTCRYWLTGTGSADPPDSRRSRPWQFILVSWTSGQLNAELVIGVRQQIYMQCMTDYWQSQHISQHGEMVTTTILHVNQLFFYIFLFSFSYFLVFFVPRLLPHILAVNRFFYVLQYRPICTNICHLSHFIFILKTSVVFSLCARLNWQLVDQF